MFCNILIEQVKDLINDGEIIDPKPISYYELNINIFVLVFNIISGACRIIASIQMLIFRNFQMKIERRQHNENEESFIEGNLKEEIKMNSFSNNVTRERDTIISQVETLKIDNSNDLFIYKKFEVNIIFYIRKCLFHLILIVRYCFNIKI
jgi:hypothetical protein